MTHLPTARPRERASQSFMNHPLNHPPDNILNLLPPPPPTCRLRLCCALLITLSSSSLLTLPSCRLLHYHLPLIFCKLPRLTTQHQPLHSSTTSSLLPARTRTYLRPPQPASHIVLSTTKKAVQASRLPPRLEDYTSRLGAAGCVGDTSLVMNQQQQP